MQHCSFCFVFFTITQKILASIHFEQSFLENHMQETDKKIETQGEFICDTSPAYH